MTDTAAKKTPAKKEAAPKTSASASNSKAFEHVAEAIRKVAKRVTFIAESELLDVEDHLRAATGNATEAKEAQKRIAERNPEA